MLRLLQQISVPQLIESWGRTTLVVGGVATGVALIVAINVINRSVLSNFQNTIDLIAGPAQLEVTLGTGEVGFPETMIDVVRADPDVVTAVPLVRGTLALATDPTDVFELFGADLTTEEDLERYRIKLATERGDTLLWLADPRSILLSSTFARARGIRVEEKIRLSTPRQINDFTVRGLLEIEGLARAFGGQIAVMDLPAAQLALGKDRLIDQIDLILRPGADVGAVQERLEAALGPALSVQRPAQRGALYENILASFQAMLTGLSLLCLVAGVYVIYNTTSTAAMHRALVMARLRVIGADARQLFRLLIVEALLLGLLGTSIGLLLGVVLARLLTGMVSDSMSVIFQLRFPVEALEIGGWSSFLCALLGMGATLFASYFAARRVTTLEPLQVLRADPSSLAARVSSRRLVRTWLLLVGVTTLALVLEVRLKSIAWGNFASTLWFASSIVIALPVVSALGGPVSRALTAWFGPEGRVAGESLFRSITRTGVTVAAVALVLTLGMTVASLSLSHRRSVTSYLVGGFLASDLAVTAVTTDGGWLETPLPGELVGEVTSTPGVSAAEALRIVPGVLFRGERIAIASGSDGFFDPRRYPPGWYRTGDPSTASELILNGTGANVSVSFADRFNVQLGDQIELGSPTGSVILTVVGVVPDYISDRGTVLFSRRIFAERWQDSTLNRIHVFLDPGASLEAVRARLLASLGDRHRVKVTSMREGVTYITDKIERAYAFTYAIQLLIVIVTVAGIFDLLVSAIWERRRELAVWRVIGADDDSVRRSVIIESAAIGVFGSALGVLVGLVTAWIWIGINYRYLLGYYLEYHFAFGTTAWLVGLVMLMTVVAGYAAARQATRQSILEGIQIE